jgi:hypothetical protein
MYAKIRAIKSMISSILTEIVYVGFIIFKEMNMYLKYPCCGITSRYIYAAADKELEANDGPDALISAD